MTFSEQLKADIALIEPALEKHFAEAGEGDAFSRLQSTP